jgi:hypothetical protein
MAYSTFQSHNTLKNNIKLSDSNYRLKKRPSWPIWQHKIQCTVVCYIIQGNEKNVFIAGYFVNVNPRERYLLVTLMPHSSSLRICIFHEEYYYNQLSTINCPKIFADLLLISMRLMKPNYSENILNQSPDIGLDFKV